MKEIFTILDTAGHHNNIRVNALKNNLPNLKVYPIYPFKSEKSLIFKILRKFFYKYHLYYRNKKASDILSNIESDIYISFSGEFSSMYSGPVILDIDDPIYSDEEINQILGENILECVVTTSRMKDKYKEIIGNNKNISIVPTPVDFLNINREIRSIKDNQFNAIYYATYITDKEYDLIIDISNKMKNIKEFHMFVIGRIPKNKPKFNKENISYYQYMDHEEIESLLNNIDIGLYLRMEDRDYRLSIKIIEMLSMGIPILSTDVSESFLIEENECGIIANPTELPEKLLNFYYDNQNYSMYSKNAINTSLKYSISNSINEYNNIIKKYSKDKKVNN